MRRSELLPVGLGLVRGDDLLERQRRLLLPGELVAFLVHPLQLVELLLAGDGVAPPVAAVAPTPATLRRGFLPALGLRPDAKAISELNIS